MSTVLRVGLLVLLAGTAAIDTTLARAAPFSKSHTMDPPVWTVTPQDFQHSMVVIGELTFDGVVSNNSGDRIAAFVDGQVRGVAEPNSSSGFTLLVFANTDGETVTFKAYDAQTDRVTDLAATVTFEANGVAGGGTTPIEWAASRDPTGPEAPILLSPVSGESATPTALTIQWREAALATTYDLQVWTLAEVLLIVDIAGVADLSYDLTGLSESTVYVWRVRAVNADGAGEWSQPFEFRTGSTPDAVAPGEPADGAENVALPVTLSWDSVEGATSYDLHVSVFADFHELTIAESGLTFVGDASGPLTREASTLTYGTTYYWRVASNNSVGSGAWSPTRHFSTAPFLTQEVLPDPPVLLAPEDGSSQPPTTVLSWQTEFGSVRYEYEISLSDDFSSVIGSENGLSSASRSVSDLVVGTTYYWHVRKTVGNKESLWSDTRQFTVASFLPGAATPLAPTDQAIDQPTRLWLAWQSAADALSHDLQVSTVADFGTLVLDATALTTPIHELTELAKGTTYFWRVRGVNDHGAGSWSASNRFSTEAGAPPAPGLLAPSDEAEGQPTRLWFAWSPSTQADGYSIELATEVTFASPVASGQVSGTTVFEAVGLFAGTNYFWRVRAENAKGSGDWSVVYRFSTAVTAPSAPVLVNPSNQSIDQPVLVELSWLPATASDATYDVQISLAVDFSVLVQEAQSLTDPAFTPGELPHGVTVYWRVRSENAAGSSPWTPAYSFTTVAAVVSAPTLLAPASGSQSQPIDLWLIWQAVAGAESYGLQVSRDVTFSTVDVAQDAIEGLQLELLSLAPATTYYWRVRGMLGQNAGPWSAAFSFTTSTSTAVDPYSSAPTARFELKGNYPNPFNPRTEIRYAIPSPAMVRLEVYDVRSRLVGTLVNERQQPGEYSVSFNADGQPSGVYLFRLQAGTDVASGTMVLMK